MLGDAPINPGYLSLQGEGAPPEVAALAAAAAQQEAPQDALLRSALQLFTHSIRSCLEVIGMSHSSAGTHAALLGAAQERRGYKCRRQLDACLDDKCQTAVSPAYVLHSLRSIRGWTDAQADAASTISAVAKRLLPVGRCKKATRQALRLVRPDYSTGMASGVAQGGRSAKAILASFQLFLSSWRQPPSFSNPGPWVH